jgi:uncharacterized protein YdhG (YjbR/CyaY superfamily)
MKPIPIDVTEYILRFPPEVQKRLERLRRTIQKAAPGAVETISYRMPAFQWSGILVWFAGYPNHIGFYPRESAVKAFKKELSLYQGAKGSVQFPHDKPLPLRLIAKIVKYRVTENLQKVNPKKN